MSATSRLSDASALSRRAFLAGAAGVLALSAGARAQNRGGTPIALNAWLAIGEDDMVRIMLSQSEMGQGISTTLPIALADELGADWAKVETAWAPFDPAYRHPQYGWMFTGNSESTASFYPVMPRWERRPERCSSWPRQGACRSNRARSWSRRV